MLAISAASVWSQIQLLLYIVATELKNNSVIVADTCGCQKTQIYAMLGWQSHGLFLAWSVLKLLKLLYLQQKIDLISRRNNNIVQQFYFERTPKKSFINTITIINYRYHNRYSSYKYCNYKVDHHLNKIQSSASKQHGVGTLVVSDYTKTVKLLKTTQFPLSNIQTKVMINGK